jgi:asparagine synthase (glutamine-hydrolysing)
MCSIVGLINKKGGDVSTILKEMLELTEHRGPDGVGIAIGTNVEIEDSLEELNVNNLEGESGLGHSRLRITGLSGIQPIYGCRKRFALGFNGEIWNYKKLRKDLMALGHVFKTDSDSEVIVHLVEEKYKHSSSLVEAVSRTVSKIDGEYAFVVFDVINQTFTLVRDPVGVKQLYYGENSMYIGFCSEKKPLWNLNLPSTRVLPGDIVEIKITQYFNKNKFNIYEGKQLERNAIEIFNERVALKAYKKALFAAVEKRVRDQNEVGIIFSGGVDSVVIAYIARQLGTDITCYTSGFRESSDVINSKKVAEEMGFKLKVDELTKGKIDRELKNIITAIESTDHLQIDVAIPIFFAVQLAKEDGIRVMLTGQGADELFAGYPWYPTILTEQGPNILTESLWSDIKNLYKDTLEREDKILMYHSIELRVPYLDPEVIEIAMSISENLKIKNNVVKYIHRKFAADLGTPSFISWRPKEAAQHGSNVHNALKNIIEEKKEDILSQTIPSGKIENKDADKLGSAYRYVHDVYSNNEDIQKVLDVIGAEIAFNNA